MKFTLLLSSLIFSSLVAKAQDSWKVYHNKIEILNTGKHDPVQNSVVIKQTSLIIPGFFELRYSEDEPQKNWIRYLGAYDGSENLLLQKKGDTLLKLSNETLKDLLAKNSIIRIFTWSLPSDPELAARIRVRRLHLCTLELK